jgi:hypothetical protein
LVFAELISISYIVKILEDYGPMKLKEFLWIDYCLEKGTSFKK